PSDCTLLVSCLHLSFKHSPMTCYYTLSLHDALPICGDGVAPAADEIEGDREGGAERHRQGDGLPERPAEAEHHGGDHARAPVRQDRKSTRLNSSHVKISYAVFCLKKKKNCSLSSGEE